MKPKYIVLIVVTIVLIAGGVLIYVYRDKIFKGKLGSVVGKPSREKMIEYLMASFIKTKEDAKMKPILDKMNDDEIEFMYNIVKLGESENKKEAALKFFSNPKNVIKQKEISQKYNIMN